MISLVFHVWQSYLFFVFANDYEVFTKIHTIHLVATFLLGVMQHNSVTNMYDITIM